VSEEDREVKNEPKEASLDVKASPDIGFCFYYISVR